MSTIATMDLAEAAFYLRSGVTLEGLTRRTSRSEPGHTRVDLVFSGERADVLGIECLITGPTIFACDLERLSAPLATLAMTPVAWGALRSVTMTAPAPNAAAERRIALR